MDGCCYNSFSWHNSNSFNLYVLMAIYFTSGFYFGRVNDNLLVSRAQRLKTIINRHDVSMAIVKRCNSVIKNTSDILYILGDLTAGFSTKRDVEDIVHYTNMLTGVKILIPSTRDSRFFESAIYNESKERLQVHREKMITALKICQTKYIMSHPPLRNWEDKARGVNSLYGQSLYSNSNNNESSYTVSLDDNDYSPLTPLSVEQYFNQFGVPF